MPAEFKQGAGILDSWSPTGDFWSARWKTGQKNKWDALSHSPHLEYLTW